MPRLIDRDLIRQMICNLHCGLSEENRIYVPLNEVLRCIDSIPTIDPVKHGHWIEDEDEDGMHCSVCGTDYCYAAEVLELVPEKYNFCPFCGDQMVRTVLCHEAELPREGGVICAEPSDKGFD